VTGRLRRRVVQRAAVLVAVLAMVAAACDVPDPTVQQLVDLDWGGHITPRYRDIAYGPDRGCGSGSDERCGGSQELDIYPARAGGNRGTLVYIHGGGFATGDKFPLTYLGNIKRQLHRGYSIVSINHRLSNAIRDASGELVVDWKGPLPWPFVRTDGSNNLPDSMADVAAALSWVKSTGSSYGLATGRVVVIGFSNAGTMAALAGTAGNSGFPVFAALPRIEGWVSIAGPLDWNSFTDGANWGKVWMGNDWPAWKNLSNPINHYDSADPPGYLLYGVEDGLVPVVNARNFDGRARRNDELAHNRLSVDIVDRLADGRVMTREAVGQAPPLYHVPTGGMNASWFDMWLDDR
jgi:acetyl esterase/lipase